MTFSGKRLPGSQETLPWHLIQAPRNQIMEKGNQIDLLFKVFQKMKLTFSWSSISSKTPKDLMHLARNLKMAKT